MMWAGVRPSLRTSILLTVFAVPVGLSGGCGGKLRPVTRPELSFVAIEVRGELVAPGCYYPSRHRHPYFVYTLEPHWRLEVHTEAEVFSEASGSVLLSGEGFPLEEQDGPISAPK